MADIHRQQIRTWATQQLDHSRRPRADTEARDVLALLDLLEQTEAQVSRLTEERAEQHERDVAEVQRLMRSIGQRVAERDAALTEARSMRNHAVTLTERAEAAEAQVLLLARTLQNLVDVAKTVRGANAFHAAIEAADAVLASLPKPETEASDG